MKSETEEDNTFISEGLFVCNRLYPTQTEQEKRPAVGAAVSTSRFL